MHILFIPSYFYTDFVFFRRREGSYLLESFGSSSLSLSIDFVNKFCLRSHLFIFFPLLFFCYCVLLFMQFWILVVICLISNSTVFVSNFVLAFFPCNSNLICRDAPIKPVKFCDLGFFCPFFLSWNHWHANCCLEFVRILNGLIDWWVCKS